MLASACLAGCAREEIRPAAAPTPTVVAAPTQTISVSTKTDHYGVADLQALEKQRAWSELVGHLADIAPADRDATWQALAEESSVALLSTISTDHEMFAALVTADDLTKRFPTLTSSKTFMSKRAEVGLKGFETCFAHTRRGDACTERMLGFVESDPNNGELAMNAGALVTRNQTPFAAVPFYRVAIVGRETSPETAKRCANDELKRAVRSGIDDAAQDTTFYTDARRVQLACSKAKGSP